MSQLLNNNELLNRTSDLLLTWGWESREGAFRHASTSSKHRGTHTEEGREADRTDSKEIRFVCLSFQQKKLKLEVMQTQSQTQNVLWNWACKSLFVFCTLCEAFWENFKWRLLTSNFRLALIVEKVLHRYVLIILQGSANPRAPGCENAPGKLRQKW